MMTQMSHTAPQGTPEFERLIGLIAEAVSSRVSAVPLDIELWTTKHIAAYLHRTEKVTSERIVTLVGFPHAIRLPTKDGGRGNPMWRAAEVVEWVAKHKEKRAG